MEKTHRTATRMRLRLWRWRRSPLRRGSDIAEAWLLLLAWVLAVLGGLAAGLVAGGSTWEALVRENAERRAVQAVLNDDAADRSRAAPDIWVWTTARWRAPDGSVRTYDVRVPSTSPAGTQVTVWTDGRGRQTQAPLTNSVVMVHATAAGVLAAGGSAGTVLIGTLAVRIALDSRRMRQWAEDWERADPWWGRRTG